jgi:hypothetical protein
MRVKKRESHLDICSLLVQGSHPVTAGQSRKVPRRASLVLLVCSTVVYHRGNIVMSPRMKCKGLCGAEIEAIISNPNNPNNPNNPKKLT